MLYVKPSPSIRQIQYFEVTLEREFRKFGNLPIITPKDLRVTEMPNNIMMSGTEANILLGAIGPQEPRKESPSEYGFGA